MTTIITGALGAVAGIASGFFANAAGMMACDTVASRHLPNKVTGFIGSSLAGALVVYCVNGKNPFAFGYRIGQTVSSVLWAASLGMGNEPNDAQTDQLTANEEKAAHRFNSGAGWGLVVIPVLSAYNPVIGALFSSIVSYGVANIGA